MGSFSCSFEVGDIVFFPGWDLCLWKIADLECRDVHPNSRDKEFIATLKLLGGIALPAEWEETRRAEVQFLAHADRHFSEMEILAMSALDCRP